MDPENEGEDQIDEQSEEQGEELPALEEGFEYQLNEDGDVEIGEDGDPIINAVSVTTDEETPTLPEDDAPAQVFLPSGEGPATAKLREMLDPEVNAAVMAAIAEQVNRSMQTFGVTQASYGAAAAAHPEIFRKYGGKIQMALTMFPEHERHTRKSVDLAIALSTIEEKAGTPEFAKEFLKIAQLMNGGAAQSAPKPPKAPIPAASRPPSPSSGARAAPVSSKDSKIAGLMKAYGLDREEAEAALYEAGRKPVMRR